MSEREWIVVRDRSGLFFVTRSVMNCEAEEREWHILARTRDMSYADGFADALNLAAEDRSVLPEWHG